MLSILNNEDISTLDRQIEQLIEFKPVPEQEVKILCEKVSHTLLTIIATINKIPCWCE
jgi:hypothetical protein